MSTPFENVEPGAAGPEGTGVEGLDRTEGTVDRDDPDRKQMDPELGFDESAATDQENTSAEEMGTPVDDLAAGDLTADDPDDLA